MAVQLAYELSNYLQKKTTFQAFIWSQLFKKEKKKKNKRQVWVEHYCAYTARPPFRVPFIYFIYFNPKQLSHEHGVNALPKQHSNCILRNYLTGQQIDMRNASPILFGYIPEFNSAVCEQINRGLGPGPSSLRQKLNKDLSTSFCHYISLRFFLLWYCINIELHRADARVAYATLFGNKHFLFLNIWTLV